LAKDNLGLGESESPAVHHVSHPTPVVRTVGHKPESFDTNRGDLPSDFPWAVPAAQRNPRRFSGEKE
jgi:hypothetical protein